MAQDRLFAGQLRLMAVEEMPELEHGIRVAKTSRQGPDWELSDEAQAILGIVVVCSHNPNRTVSSLLLKAGRVAEGSPHTPAAFFKNSYGVPHIALRAARWFRQVRKARDLQIQVAQLKAILSDDPRPDTKCSQCTIPHTPVSSKIEAEQ